MKLNVIEKWLTSETDMKTWLTSTNMSIPHSSPSHSPRHHRMKPHEYVCSFSWANVLIVKQCLCSKKWRMATIDFIATAVSGKLFECYDCDEYQK